MKNGILFLLFIVISLHANARGKSAGVRVTALKIEKSGQELEIRFNLAVDRRAVSTGNTMYLSPVLASGSRRASLPLIVVQDRKAAIASERREQATGSHRACLPGLFRVRGGETLSYVASLPYHEWIDGADLVLESLSVGCCATSEMQVINKWKISATGELPAEGRVKEASPRVAPVELLDKASVLASGKTFDYRQPLLHGRPLAGKDTGIDEFIDNNREGALTVLFSQGSHAIESDLADNARAIAEILSVIRQVDASGDARIARVIIAGFASPEGPTGFNDRLAWNRAVAMKQLLVANTPVDPASILLLNGRVDWRELHRLVSGSAMRHKRAILGIIEDTLSGRNTGEEAIARFKRIDEELSYREMHDTLFPRLRNTTYIKIYTETENHSLIKKAVL